jgi:hypothetical protein
MDINNGYDRHLDPPDSDEAVFCEFCGQEMEHKEDFSGEYNVCINLYCPIFFVGKAEDMANHLVEVEQELRDTQSSLKYVRARLSNVQLIRERREKTIEELESQIEKLTQSQSKGE